MTTTAIRVPQAPARLARAVVALFIGAQVVGCAAPGPAAGAAEHSGSASATAGAPSALAPALRCMDGLLLDHGVRDVSVVLTPSSEGDKQAQADLTTFVAAAVSDITQRSRSIRLVMAGADWPAGANQAQQLGASAPAPQYALRGALARNAGTNAQGKTIGLSLALLNTADMSIVPGMSTRNEISVRAGPAAFNKFGQPFSVAAATTPAVATRAVVELATIEMFGRLARLPYWTCLGVDGANPAVRTEIQDWYDTMASRPADIITYFQQALRQRQLYAGPVDGNPNAEFKESIAITRQSLGQPRDPKLSIDFFNAWLTADASTMARARTALAASVASANAAATAALAANATTTSSVTPASDVIASGDAVSATNAATSGTTAPSRPLAQPLSLRVVTGNDARRFTRGEAVKLMIRPSRDANVYCFLQDEKRHIVRFFPNRFQRDSRVTPARGLQLPGEGRFELVMNPRGVVETVACFATDTDVLAQLPGGLNGGDFSPLPTASLEQIKSAFVNVSGGVLGHESLELRAR